MNYINKLKNTVSSRYEPAEIILGKVFEPAKNAQKVRPVIVVSLAGSHYDVIPLTTQAEAKHNDYYRVPLPWRPTEKTYSYIWDRAIHYVYQIDAAKHLDWIDLPCLEVILANVEIPRRYRCPLIRNAYEHTSVRLAI